ncbi:MAG: hypothetical protein HPY68_02285 [Candidatus Atribacteria bacterium]|nr:hypothetical protein [Candidatus Atribacteria bacterium]
MPMASRTVRNEDVQKIIVEIPENHKHARTTILLNDGTELVFQEATIANLVRAYTTVKTHPFTTRVVLVGQKVLAQKEGYAEWQLLEETH